MTTQTSTKWREVKLGNITEIESGGTPSSSRSEYWDNGDVCWATLPDLRSKYLFDTERKITDLGLKNSSAKMLPINSVIFSSRATIGEISIAKVETSTNQGSKNFICDPKQIEYEFLYYLLKSKVEEISSLASGATYKEINKTVFSEVKVNIPDLQTQKQITGVLSVYDDLIENNNHRIKILEEIAQKIYNEWFVNFRFPGYEKTILIKNGLPDGWELRKLRDIVSYYIGGGWGEEEQSENFDAPGFVIRGTDIPSVVHGDNSTVPFRFHKESNLRNRKAEPLDIVFEVSGGSKDQPVGRHALLTEKLFQSFSGDVIFASFCKLIRIQKDLASPYMISLAFSEMYKNEVISKYQVQSTGISNFRFENFIDEVDIMIPDQDTRKKFDCVIEDIFTLIHETGMRNMNLKKSRDLLIPQLVTGKLEINI